MKPEAIHTIIGVGLVCIAFGVLGGVAFLLYGSEFSLSFLPIGDTSRSDVQEYVCSDNTRVSVTYGENSTVAFGGRTEEVVFTPVPEGVEVPPDAWDRYASQDASFVLWKRGTTILVQENGVVTHGQCELSQ
ncbi:hypothetical protein C4585_00665 [Candidatus Parcubacteria bacterium]|nr:MAG: hypothetical protein C4585_00665 [Candidatus Parcubacteria bacterium]